MEEVNEIMDTSEKGNKQFLLGKFYQNAKHKRLARILCMEKTHPVRYSTINPQTGAELYFKGKRQSGFKVRWARDIIKTAWENTRWELKGEDAKTGATEYITNTVGIKEEEVAKNIAAIIA